MNNSAFEIPQIPHGHGLSFKKGVADALLNNREHEQSCHKTHSASYNEGQKLGLKLLEQISKHVKA